MSNSGHLIALVGLNGIIKEGLLSLIQQADKTLQVKHFEDLASMHYFSKSNDFILVFIDASHIFSGHKLIMNLKRENNRIAIVAVQYQFVSNTLLNICDDVITIDQTSADIVRLILKVIEKSKDSEINERSEQISDREMDVLKLLVKGLSAKEIAESLNISVNTVTSHRKNISQKTGIKSLAGLTIYAVSNKIISINNIK